MGQSLSALRAISDRQRFLKTAALLAFFYAASARELRRSIEAKGHSGGSSSGPLTKGILLVNTIYITLELALHAVFGFLIQSVIRLFTWPFDKNCMISGRFFRLIGVSVTRFAPIWNFRVHGRLPYDVSRGVTPGRTIVVSNHESLLDPFLISNLPWEMKWLSKDENFRIPFVGWSMSLAGDIRLKRGQRDSAKDAMKQCRDYLMENVPVCIFPEGTRSENGEIGLFKDGAFRLAIETGADILPIAIAGSHRALPKHHRIFHPSQALVTCGTPISTKGMAVDDVASLSERVRNEIIRLKRTITPFASHYE